MPKVSKVTPSEIVQGIIVAGLTSGTVMGGLRLLAYRRKREASARLEDAAAEVKQGEAWQIAFRQLEATVKWQGERVAAQQRQIGRQHGEIEELRAAVVDYQAEKVKLESENKILRERVRSLEADVASLRERLGSGQ